ncbi:MAG: TonB-dependent receptor, partial [Proteobacteria bacterium]|nr:TonB-dependent receptor [Pseudomonadota bacterium]
ADLLVQTPGVSFSRNGGIGSNTSLRIRGAEADQTVVVIDGVKLNDPSSPGGGFNFGNLLLGDVSRIEVLRGAQSTLWGSQAIGGVVNLVTAEPTEPFQGSLEVEGGSRETAYLRAGVGGASDRVVWRLAGGRFQTGGFSAFVRGTEDDGYQNTGLSARARFLLTDVLSLDLRAVRSEGRLEFDGFPPPRFAFADTREVGRTTEFVGYAGLNLDLLDGRFRNRLAYGHTETRRNNVNPDQANTTVTFAATGENRRLEYQGVFAVRDELIATFGAETETSEFRTASPTASRPNPPVASAEVGIDAVYGQLQAEVAPGLTLTGGLRRDEHEVFGGATLGQLAAAWSLNGGSSVLRASFGQGFKAPTLFQLYSLFGNLALEPEQADSYDAGVEQRLLKGRVTVSATYFARRTEQQINFVSCAAGAVDPLCFNAGSRRSGFFQNLSQTRAQGVELQGQAELGRLGLSANYSWTDAENDSPGSDRGRRLPRRPEHQANLGATWTFASGASSTVAVRHAGESFDNASNSIRLKGYTLVDVRAAYPIGERAEVYARIENLTDETYETARNFGVPGRGGFIGVRGRF